MARVKAQQYYFYILLGAVAVFCIILFAPYLPVLVIAAALAVTLRPVCGWINKKIARGHRWLAALITLILLIVIIGVPLYFIGSRIISEANSLYVSLTSAGKTFSLGSLFPALPIGNALGDISSIISQSVATVFSKTLATGFSAVLGVLALFYFLKDGSQWKKYLVRLSPLSVEYDERILTMLERAVNGVMRGYVLIAIVQGTLMGIGLWIFGVPNPALWGLVAGIASMIPTIGTATVSVPAFLYLLATGATGSALGFAAWAAVLVGTIDNILNPIVVGKQIDLHPMLILFAVLGGIALLGPAGIVIGPLSIALLDTLMTIYQEDFGSSRQRVRSEQA